MSTISGTNSFDTIFGTASDDSISGLDQEDFLAGLSGNDTLEGGNGDDFLNGGLGDDRIDGGAGSDMADYASATVGVSVDLNNQGSGQNTGDGSDTLVSIESLFGSSFTDTLTGDSSANYLHGYNGGSDLLDGMGGADVLEVQRFASSPAANITMLGGAGNDTLRYFGSGASDSATLNGGGSHDSIEATGLLNGTVIANGGNDTVSIDTLVGQYSISLGAGADMLILQSTGGGFRAADAINISDFVAGNGADKVDLSVWIAGGALQSYGGGNPFLSQHLQLFQNGPDTELRVDRDGGGNDWSILLTFQNTTATAFTAANFGGYLPAVDGQPLPDPLTGTEEADTIPGSENADSITGLGGMDELFGAGGADIIVGGTEDDALFGEDGSDSLDGGDGADYLVGGDLHDTLLGNAGFDLLIGGAGDDLLDGGADEDMADYSGASSGVTVNLNQGAQNTGEGTDTLVSIEDVFGSSYTDTLTGDGNANYLDAGDGGSDRLDGNGGDDYLNAQRFFSGGASITMMGDGGNDTLVYYGYEASDSATLDGGTNNDTIIAISLADGTILAGAGNDSVSIDTLTGVYDISLGTGDDTLTFQSTVGDFRAADAITVSDFATGNGNDVLDLSAWIAGGALLNYSGGSPVMSGHLQLIQSGPDTLLQVDRDGGGDSFETLITFQNVTASSFTAQNMGGIDFGSLLTGTNGPDTLSGTAFGDMIDGLDGADSLSGSDGDDTLLGSGDDDTLAGGIGHDLLDGGAGSDSMAGNSGDDSYVADSIGDIISEISGEGTDTVEASVSFTLDSNIENLTLTGSGDIDGTGNTSANTITGNSGSNSLSGSSGNDTLNGGEGNDTLDGGTNNDSMSGGDGDDSYVVNAAADEVSEAVGEGTDSLASSITYVLGANIENLTLTGNNIHGAGNEENNLITGSTGSNSLSGGGGSDTLIGNGGNDTMAGGLGDDVYEIDSASDVVSEATGEGIDQINASASFTLGDNVEHLTLTGSGNIAGTGNGQDNVLTGNSGSNTLDGGVGNDTMSGGIGDDGYVVDSTSDVVTEAADSGTDSVTALMNYILGANLENLTLSSGDIDGAGNGENNVLTGSAGNNSLSGGDGNDTLVGNGGDDSLTGGVGDDAYTIDSASDVVTEDASAGTDSVSSSVAYTLTDNVENLTLTGTGGIAGTGNTQNNVITGNTGNNSLTGLDGTDTIMGGNGADTIDGGSGADSMTGGIGNDRFIVDDAGDQVSEDPGAGTDTVEASVSFTLGSDIERLTLTGIAAINGAGNALNNIITGNSGNNSLTGGAGDDDLSGGAGDDIYEVDSSGDSVVESAGEGTDTVYASASFDLGNNIETLTLIGTADIDGRGNNSANTITGNSGNNSLTGDGGADTLVGDGGHDTINGGAGNDSILGGEGDDRIDGGNNSDTMAGGAGDDNYVVNAAADDVIEAAGEGTDSVTSSAAHTLDANVENLTLTGTGNIAGIGNDEHNAITGNSGNNNLSGGNGNDTLNGDLGADTLTGGSGTDNFVFSTILGGGNIDSVTTFAIDAELIQLAQSIFTDLSTGTLAASAFTVGSAASTAEHRIIYNSATGALSYDSDGNGAAAAQQFATLQTGLGLDNADFLVF